MPQLTQKVHDEIVRHLKTGAFLEHAARAAGVTSRSARRWIERGKRGEGDKFVRFYEDVERERALDAIRAQAVVTAAMVRDRDWKAAAWLLERKYPALYSNAAIAAARVTLTQGGTGESGDGTGSPSTTTRVEFYLPSNGRRPDEQ